ncbi:TBC1 domain family member 2A isoform X2 [Centroberyx gerrardi]
MEGGSPGGNPSAASSRSFPAQAEPDDGADWISAPAASEGTAPDTNSVGRPAHEPTASAAGDQQSRSEEERTPSRSGSLAEESPTESLNEDDQAAGEPAQQTHQDPPTDQQNPEDPPPTEDSTASTSEKHQNQKDRTHCLSGSQAEESPTESLTKENQTTEGPAQPSPTDQQNHQDPPSTKDSTASTSVKHQTQQDCPPEDQQTQKDPPSTDQQNQKDPLSTDRKTHQLPPHKDQQTRKDPPSTKQQKQKDPPPKHQQTQQDHLPTDQQPRKDLSSTDQQKQKDPPPKHQKTKQDRRPKDQQTQKDLPSEDQQKQKDPLSTNQQTKKGRPPKDLQTLKDPSSTDQQKQKVRRPKDQQTKQDSPLIDQKTQQFPPTNQQIQQDSPPKDQQNQKDLPSKDQQKQKDPLSTDHKTHQFPPPTDQQTQQEPPRPTDQKIQKDPPPKDQQLQKDPPSTDQQSQKDPLSKSQKTQQDSPPRNRQTQQDPPHPTDHQTPEQPAPLAPPPNLHPTKPSALAPPVTIEAFCDQVQPRPPASSSSSSSSGEPKLCGYLQKQGGPLKAWKQRWFTYEEKKSQLFYYRTPQDVTPLGRVELGSATFTYPLKAEDGTFHIQTPERTFILKAVTQQLMLYWLQQLQLKRWQHRAQQSGGSNNNNNNSGSSPDDFLPALKSPLGLVGEEAANLPSQRTPLANMSIKHPLIEIQNSVHSLRFKRSSQEWSQSVFHVEAPPWTPPTAAASQEPAVPRTPVNPPTPTTPLPVPVPVPASPAGQRSPADGRQSPSLFDSHRSRRKKSRSSSTMPTIRRDTSSSDRMSRLQQEKHMLAEEVKAQKELVWLLHKALEAAQLEKRTCAEFLAAKGEQERLELLRHRERQAADLRGRLEELKAEGEELRRSLAQRDAQLAELQENISLMVEKNHAKQEVILKLSDQLTACMSDPPRSVSSNGLEDQTLRQQQQDIENLKDDINAYKTQNKFLNSEIYQLTQLWRNSSEQEKSLMVKCAYLEASNCQVESRYLGVLRKLQENKALDPGQREAVRKLVEDALRGDLKSVIKLNPVRDHDEYGFKIVPDYEVEDMKLLAKIQALEIRSHNLLHQEAGDRPLLGRWAQYLAGRSDDDLCPSPELKSLLRGGVPQEYRRRVWRWVVRARTWSIRERHPQRYEQLCEKSRTSPHPASRQIQLDLHRTLTTNQHFSSPSSPALQQLRRVLLAFSWQNHAIGYCQGLNRLAAIALLVLQSEEDAFWCLVAVVEAMMPQDYYTKNLVASQADQRVLKEFMAEKLPRLAAHFEEHSIDVSLITFNWFLVVFVESLPSDILLRLWDAFLYEGTKVIFRYALALFKYKEDDILKIHDNVEIYQYLRFFTKTISDGRKLTSIAFNDMNPFPGRLLRNRRAVHLERLQGELRELEEQQREFETESAERKDKELDTMVSEDDDEL